MTHTLFLPRRTAPSATVSRAAVAVALGLGLFAGGTASAFDPFWGGVGVGRGSLVGGNERIPYFAAHPSVYYSQAVPRPYGYSPYPLLPGQVPVEPVVTPVAPVAPKMILNPFVPSATGRPTDAAPAEAGDDREV